jgi:hypothetical protein
MTRSALIILLFLTACTSHPPTKLTKSLYPTRLLQTDGYRCEYRDSADFRHAFYKFWTPPRSNTTAVI